MTSELTEIFDIFYIYQKLTINEHFVKLGYTKLLATQMYGFVTY